MKKKIIKIIKLLKQKKFKISIAESCTGGMLSSAITSISGASKVFDMGLVTYSNQSKTSILKVPKRIIKKHGSVSVQSCLSMVNNLNKISKSKICVSITGIAGPSGGTKQKPIGLVYIGIGTKRNTITKEYLFIGNRLKIRQETTLEALKLSNNIIESFKIVN